MEKIEFDKDKVTDSNLIGWNNKCASYFNYDTLPEGCDGLTCLNGKGVVYYIVTPDSMLYIGSTGDFGGRVATHLKDSRMEVERKLYKNMQLYGVCLFGILGVCDDVEESRKLESKYIAEYKEMLLSEHFGSDYKFLISEEERKSYLFNMFYNIKD